MKRITGSVSALRTMSILLLVALGIAPNARAAVVDCHREAAALRESLEVVAEATIDGRSADVPPAAGRATTWWKAHGRGFGSRPQAGTQIQAMAASARRGDAKDAARQAVLLATASFDWCKGARRTDDELMLLDLVGMTAWLRARGTNMNWPARAQQTTQSLVTQLTARKNTSLASQLREAVTAAMASPVRANGDAKPAIRLLDLVDVAEKALR